ncbi:MAG: 2Fe-2S iron-sulfur cluster-binding protein [Dehalococcoidia bacterium]|jgi:formate dehydrogenase major subunit/NADH-quinone oxidoreductase subunit G
MLNTIIIEGKEIKVKSGSNLLWAALDNGIFIPNLCSIRDNNKPFASCRLCFVEIDGTPNPVTACTEKVIDGMNVTINSPATVKLRRSSFNLLLSHHRLDCGRCPKNRKCELQHIAQAEHFKLNDKRLKKIDANYVVDSSHALFAFDKNKCVLCGRCVWVCQRESTGVLDFAHRGINTIVSTFAGTPISETDCNSCLSCVAVCPVGALYTK